MLRFVKSATLVLLLCLPASVHADDADRALVSVSGEGRVTAAPDIGHVVLGVSRQAATAAGAMQAASSAAAEILASVQAAGIEPRDVQTVRVALNPVWEHRQNQSPKITGYEAVNDLAIRVRNLDGMGALIDDLVRDGANSVQQISFSIDDTTALRAEARRAAVVDARARAETLADAAGVTLGTLRHLAEAGGAMPPPPMPMMRMDMAMAESMGNAVPIAAGELEIVVHVSASWEIAQE